MWKYLRFKYHRKTRRLRNNLHLWRLWLFHYFERHVYGGWQKLGNVRWIMLLWVAIVALSFWGIFAGLGRQRSFYLAEAAAPGGHYSEGVSGNFGSINPLFAENAATDDAVRLVFSGLTKLDSNANYQADLADHWDISTDKKVYTFYLRQNVKWQDGANLTANDVAFTISRIQNPDTRSPLAGDWNGVQYAVLNDSTIRFTLPSSYSEFLYNTTVGILPKHLLENIKPSLLRLHEFNQKPVGSGPYEFTDQASSSNLVQLRANPEYYLGKPYIDSFELRSYQTAHDEISAYARKEIQGLSKVIPEDVSTVKQINSLKMHQLSQPAYVAAFFNLKNPLINQLQLRQGLAYGTNRDSIVHDLLQDQAARLDIPVAPNTQGLTSGIAHYGYDTNKAKATLATAGQNITLKLATLKDSIYQQIAEELKRQWSELGVKVDIVAVDSTSLQQDFIRPRNYDVLVYGQNIGIDSDVYSFWHSSQANDPGLNVSSYKNGDVDKFLEAGRIARDPVYKLSRYNGFLTQWSHDEPAIILYSPYYNYAQSTEVHGFDTKRIVQPQDRFDNASKWYINTTEKLKARQ